MRYRAELKVVLEVEVDPSKYHDDLDVQEEIREYLDPTRVRLGFQIIKSTVAPFTPQRMDPEPVPPVTDADRRAFVAREF